MAYKDYHKTENDIEEKEQNVDAMFFSRPLILPNGAFGALNFFFDPEDISSMEIETLGNLVADFIDNYWIMKEKNSSVTN